MPMGSLFARVKAAAEATTVKTPPPVLPPVTTVVKPPVRGVERQLEIVKGLMGYKYGDENVDRLTTEFIVRVLGRMGINDIRDLGVRDVNETVACLATSEEWDAATTHTISGYHFFNKQTGGAVSETFSIVYAGGYPNSDGTRPCGTRSVSISPVRNGAYRFYLALDPEGTFTDTTIAGIVSERYSIEVWVKFTEMGIPYFFVNLFDLGNPSLSSGWGEAARFFALIFVAVGSIAVPGINILISQMIFGPALVAAYPAVTAALTSTLLQTALNGGDVEAAVKSVATGYLGAQVGSVVSGVTDSEAIGKLASSAVTTASRGGDVEAALLSTAIRLAPGIAVDAVSAISAPSAPVIPPSIPYHDPVYDAPPEVKAMPYDDSDYFPAQAPIFTDVDYSNYTFDYDSDTSWLDDIPIDLVGDPMFDPGVLAPNFDASSVPLTPGVLQPMESWSDGSGVTDTVNVFPNSSPDMTQLSDSTNVPLTPGHFDNGVISDDNSVSFFKDLNFRDVVSGVSDVAVALLRVNSAYQQAGRPSIQPTVTVRPVSNVVETARPNGTIVITNPANGQTTVTRMPVGVPYVLPSGAVVTNNGDGTFTTIDQNGAKISTYAPITSQVGSGGSLFTGSTLISGVPDYAIYGGGALLLVALLSARR